MTAICYSHPILLKFDMHIFYIENFYFSEFGCSILTNHKNQAIVPMAAICYTDPILMKLYNYIIYYIEKVRYSNYSSMQYLDK